MLSPVHHRLSICLIILPRPLIHRFWWKLYCLRQWTAMDVVDFPLPRLGVRFQTPTISPRMMAIFPQHRQYWRGRGAIRQMRRLQKCRIRLPTGRKIPGHFFLRPGKSAHFPAVQRRRLSFEPRNLCPGNLGLILRPCIRRWAPK